MVVKLMAEKATRRKKEKRAVQFCAEEQGTLFAVSKKIGVRELRLGGDKIGFWGEREKQFTGKRTSQQAFPA